jgi:hypothetical protein
MKIALKEELPFCECGCGERVKKPGNRFINGHNSRGKNNYMYGKKCPEQSKRTSGKNNPMYGKKHSTGTRKKQSKARKRQFCGENNPMFGVRICGEDNHNWRGGIAGDPYCPLWQNKELKNIIKNRDRNIAWDIGYWYKKDLCVNHIDFDKKNCAMKNLITVSRGMNTAVNFHREFYTEWFQIAMNHRLGYEYGI